MTKDGNYIDDIKYQKHLRKLEPSSLRHLIKDAQDAIAANPQNLNNGYYQDEIHYAAMELRRRGVS